MQVLLLPSAARSLRSSPSLLSLLLLPPPPRMHNSPEAMSIHPSSSSSPPLPSSLSTSDHPLPSEHPLRPSLEALPAPLLHTWAPTRNSCIFRTKQLYSKALVERWAAGKNRIGEHHRMPRCWPMVSLAVGENGGRVKDVVRHSLVFHLFRLGLGLGLGSQAHQVFDCVQGAGTGDKIPTLSGALPFSSDAASTQGVNDASREGLQDRPLRLFSGVYSLPHPDKEAKGGEDAYFVSPEEQALGVADGVGGWASVGVDAGLYARELMMQSTVALRQEPEKCIDPARVLLKAHSRTQARGSSTACIVTLSEYGLQAANLGDSGFVVLRNGHVVFKSSPQQHAFNFPYQLGSESSDPPSSAEVLCFQVEAGDTIVLGTDGLFDNVFDHELTRIVLKSTQAGLAPDAVAKELAHFARQQAQNPYCDTPFSTAAQFAGVPFYGGKLDDITVIVSFVIVEAENSAQKLERSS